MFSGLDLIEEALDVSFPLEELITLVGLRQVWVACDIHDVPVGMVIASVRDGAAHIEEMDVLPAHGRRGLGTLLLNQVCVWAEASGPCSQASGPQACEQSGKKDTAWPARRGPSVHATRAGAAST
jgi:GNAT superfamily N-acetyltransferase